MSEVEKNAGRAPEVNTAGLAVTSFNETQTGAAMRPGAGAAMDFTGNLDVVMKIPVSVKVVLGSTSMPVASLLKLGRGAVIPLDRRVGDPVEVVVNDHVVARGEVVVISEEGSKFGISLTEIVGSIPQDKTAA